MADKPAEDKEKKGSELALPSTSTSTSSKSTQEDESKKKAKEKKKKEQEKDDREKMLLLVSNFTDDQLDRYEMYRRAAFPKAAIKRTMQTITGGAPIGQNVIIAMAGIAKVFAGEVVEAALDYKDELGETGAVKPKHLREAARRIREKGGEYPRAKKKKLF